MSGQRILTLRGLLAISLAASCGPESASGLDAHADRGGGGAASAGGGGGGGGGSMSADAAHDAPKGGAGGTTDAPVDLALDDAGIMDTGVDLAPETCGPDGHGCAKLIVPLTDQNTGTLFQITVTPTDLTGVVGVFRFCLLPAAATVTSGWVQPYAQEGVSPFAGHFDQINFSSLPVCPTFIDYAFTFDISSSTGDAGAPWYTRTQYFGLKIQSLSGPSGSWANPTVVYVDSITLSRRDPDGGATDADGGTTTLPGPYTFDTSASQFSISSYMAVPGSAINWVP